jgi:hypothetical protein
MGPPGPRPVKLIGNHWYLSLGGRGWGPAVPGSG